MTTRPARIDGIAIRELRERAGLTQRRLALLAACDVSLLPRLEMGTRSTSIATLASIATALNDALTDEAVTVDRLLVKADREVAA